MRCYIKSKEHKVSKRDTNTETKNYKKEPGSERQTYRQRHA